MALTAYIVSEQVNAAEEQVTLTREYRIYDPAGTAAVSFTSALGLMPSIGDNVTAAGVTTECTQRSVQSVADSNSKVWTGTAVYTWTSTTEGGDTFTQIDMNTVVNFVDVYRVGASFPFSASSPGNGDIGGTKVDAAGEPVSATVYQQEISVVNIKPDDQRANIIAALGKRNSASFLGFNQDYVLFLGASARKTAPGKYEITYRFLYDGAKHLRQICARDVDGQPLLDAPDGNGNATARHVMARQPFPETNSFAGLALVV